MTTPFLHQLPDIKDLYQIVAKEQGGMLASLVEKDYWIL